MIPIMIKRILKIIVLILISSLIPAIVIAYSPPIENGLSWFSTNQNPDGGWGSNADLSVLDTSTVLDTFKFLNVNTSEYSNGVAWLNAQSPTATDFLSRKVTSLYMAGADVSIDLSTLVSNRNSDGGWGGDADSTSMINDTALALQALKAVNYPDQNIISSAITYLTNTQNTDGGWGFYPSTCSGCNDGDDSNVYMTAFVSSTLQQFPRTTSLATAINKAIYYLIVHQNPDGGFGSGGASPTPTSTVYETALTYLALADVTTDATILGNAINYLTFTQSSDGSWLEDPYSTALAIRALYLWENRPASSSTPTGTVTGKVVDTYTNQPLSSAVVILQSNASIRRMTDQTGGFSINNIPEGTQTLTISLTGYATAAVTVNVTSGSIIDLGDIPLSANPETGIVKGTVTDASTNQPLHGASVTIDGSYTGNSATDTSGTFIFTNVTPGSITLTATNPGYNTVTNTGTVTAGAMLYFNAKLSPAALTGNLTGKITDSSSGMPLQGAQIMLSGVPAGETDAQGIFLITDITPETYQMTVSAAGYISRSSQIIITAGTTTDMQTIQLTRLEPPAPLSGTALTGTVTDMDTGETIAGAKITIIRSGRSATTGSDGTYILTGITPSEGIEGTVGGEPYLLIDLRITAIGYNGLIYSLMARQDAVNDLSFTLKPSALKDLNIISLQTDKQSYGANEKVVIDAVMENKGMTGADGVVTAEIQNAAGQVVSMAGAAEPRLTFTPVLIVHSVITWDTAQFLPGEYTVTLKIIEANSITYETPNGILVAQKTTSFSIQPMRAVIGYIQLNPPVTQANMQTPVAITAAMRNTGNIMVTATLILEAALNGNVVYSQNASITDLQVNNIHELDFGSFIPQEGGNFSIILRPVDPSIASNISTTLYVGPHATATFAVTPDKAITGDARVTGKIMLTGIGSSTGTTQDPLVPLIKDAIQEGVNWGQTTAVNWQNGANRLGVKCYGCHVQTQTLIGLELSRDKVTVDDSIPAQLLNFMKGFQSPDGYLAYYFGGTGPLYPVETTTLFAWSLSYYHDSTQIQEPLIKALDYLITKQSTAGYWVSDYCYGTSDWWNDLGCGQPSTPFTAYNTISLIKAYHLSGLQKYKDSMLSAVNYLKDMDHAKSIITASHIIIGLQSALPLIDDQNLKTAAGTKIAVAVEYIRSTENTNGGWGRYAGDISDPLPTAHVLYAMSIAGIQGTDSGLRDGTLYLLNKQNPDGTWTTAFIRHDTYPDKYFGATTWAIISLPITLETIAGVSADLTVTLPSNIMLNNSSITPEKVTPSGNNTAYLWNWRGWDENVKDLLLDLTLKSLQSGEQRKAVSNAYLSFKDIYTGNIINLPLDIPIVTGISPATIDVSTDKEIYHANEVVNITTSIANISSEMRSPTAKITIEDIEENTIQEIAQFQIDNLSPPYEALFLSGWKNRIKLKLDHTKIDADLTDFPVRIHLSRVSGINNSDVSNIFNELGDNHKKIAITTSDGKTQCYVEIERWDAANKEADLWVKVPALSFTEDTVLYLYYDSNQIDNTTYVGIAGEASAKNVWDSAFKGVWHLSQDPSGATQILDSTSNGNKGISQGGMTSDDLVDGLAGKAIAFDGVDDTIKIPSSASLKPTNQITLSCWVKLNSYTQTTNMPAWPSSCIYKTGGPSSGYVIGYALMISATGVPSLEIDDNNVAGYAVFGPALSLDEWHYLVGTYDGSYMKLYINGVLVNNISRSGVIDNSDYSLYIANSQNEYANPDWYSYISGIIDGVSISSIARSTAWIKASYYSQSDNLISFGSEESINDIDPSSTRTYNFIWNTGTTLSDDYLVRARLYENEAFLTEDIANFTILPDNTLTANVTTDKMAYFANEPVTITSTIQSLSANYIFENLNVKISISNNLGTVLYTETDTSPVLIPHQLIEFKTYWNTSINPSGNYPVTLEVKDASGSILSVTTTNLIITSDIKPSKLLNGLISVDKQSLLQGEPVAITYSITNAGNINLSQIDLSIPIVHVVELTSYNTLTDQTALQMGVTYTNTQQLNTQNYSAKDYLVILRATISGVEETVASTYFRVEGAPSAPSLYSPKQGEDVETLNPTLTVNNASDPNDDNLTYEFELYADSSLSTLLASSGTIPEGRNTTSWQIPITLQENAVYYWRARAYDGLLYGEWMSSASFRVNLINEPPTAPTLSSPADNSSVDTLMPVLTVNNASDPDSSNLTYNFELSLDADFIQIVTSKIGVFEGEGTTSWQVPIALNENAYYYWRAQADDWFITGPWMTTARFFVNTANDAPTTPSIISPINGSEITALYTDVVASNSTDPDSANLTYIFEADTVMTFDSPDLIRSGNISEGQGTTSWHLDGLQDNTYYYVRVKASDGLAESQWSEVMGFFVNTGNDAPTTPVLANPSDGSGVNVFNPTLSVHNSSDIDGDALTYDFEIYEDAAMTTIAASITGIIETPRLSSWIVPVSLIENKTYYWRTRAFDGELYSNWMPAASFMVNTANDAPDAPTLHSPADGSSLDTLNPTLSVHNAADPDSDSLTYDFEIYSNGILIKSITGIPQDISGITSVILNEALSDNSTYRWRARAYDGDRYGAWMDMASFSIHLPVTNITATIDFDPNTLNKKSNGTWVVVYIELPAGYNVTNIAISSIRLEGIIPAESWPYSIGDYDKDGIPDLMVKFKRSSVINILPNGDNVIVHVTGMVGTTTFEGVDRIRVIP